MALHGSHVKFRYSSKFSKRSIKEKCLKVCFHWLQWFQSTRCTCRMTHTVDANNKDNKIILLMPTTKTTDNTVDANNKDNRYKVITIAHMNHMTN